MADFVEYAKGSSQSEWGRKRAADGHPAPYRFEYLELGNEERVDEYYWQQFKPLAQAIWAKDPEVILVVGDLSYAQPIQDPFHFQGAALVTNRLPSPSPWTPPALGIQYAKGGLSGGETLFSGCPIPLDGLVTILRNTIPVFVHESYIGTPRI